MAQQKGHPEKGQEEGQEVEREVEKQELCDVLGCQEHGHFIPGSGKQFGHIEEYLEGFQTWKNNVRVKFRAIKSAHIHLERTKKIQWRRAASDPATQPSLAR